MNITTEEFNAIYSKWMITNTVILVIFLTVGTLGNAFALFLYTFRVPHTEERFFIPFLVVVDLIVCISGATFSIILNFYRANFPSSALCKTMYYLTWGSINYSAGLLFILALHRYKKICRPNSAQWSERQRRIALGVVGTFSFILTIPIILLFGEKRGHLIHNGSNVTLITCNIQNSSRDSSFYYFGFIIVYFMVLMTMIIVLYSLIGITIFRRFQVIRASRKVRYFVEHTESTATLEKSSITSDLNDVLQNHKNLENRNQFRKHIRQNFTGMFAAIIVFWAISYIPTIIMIIVPAVKNSIEFWFHMSPAATNILLCLKRAFLFNHIVNPFIYGYFDIGFRGEAARLICFWRTH
jgi:hypothetical protein